MSSLTLNAANQKTKSETQKSKSNKSSITRITFEKKRRNLIATQEKIQFVSLEQYDSTRYSSNTKPASRFSASFALGCFSIRPVQDLREPHEYGYSRMKELHEYRYFRTEEPHEYGYPIVKKLDGDIQSRHGFQVLVIADKQVQEQADYTLEGSRV